jgi:hypothetical protein
MVATLVLIYFLELFRLFEILTKILFTFIDGIDVRESFVLFSTSNNKYYSHICKYLHNQRKITNFTFVANSCGRC